MDVNVPKPFNPNKNQIAKDWQIWKEEFLIYLRASRGYEKLTEERRALLLLNLMGTKAVEAVENMSFDNPSDIEDMDILLTKFDETFDPPSNEVEDRFKFFSRIKNESEPIDKYIMDLKEKAVKCKFGAQTEKFIIDMVIRNMDNYLRQMTFNENDVNLDKIIENYKRYDVNTEKIKELSQNTVEDIDSRRKDDASNVINNNHIRTQEIPRRCWRCNTFHQARSCPAYGRTCRICNEKNHLDGLCRREPRNNVGSTSRPRNEAPPSYFQATQFNTRLEDCLWCGTKHFAGQCAHDSNCAYCLQFPHNVCFSCKHNPHLDNCHLKIHTLHPRNNDDTNSTAALVVDNHDDDHNDNDNDDNNECKCKTYYWVIGLVIIIFIIGGSSTNVTT